MGGDGCGVGGAVSVVEQVEPGGDGVGVSLLFEGPDCWVDGSEFDVPGVAFGFEVESGGEVFEVGVAGVGDDSVGVGVDGGVFGDRVSAGEHDALVGAKSGQAGGVDAVAVPVGADS